MIKHNALEDRLNAVREGKPIPKTPAQFEINSFGNDQSQIHKIVTLKHFFISEAYKLFNVLATSALYGFGLKAIFSTDWAFIGTLGVGFLLNHSLTILLKLLKK
jgi:hypothetical protein